MVASIGLESLNTDVLDEDFGKAEPSIKAGMELNDRNIEATGNILSYDWSRYNTFNILLRPSGGISAEAFQKAMHENFIKLYPLSGIPAHLIGDASFSIEVMPCIVTSVAVRIEYLKKMVEKSLPFPFPLPFMPK